MGSMRNAANRKMPVHLNLNVRGLGASATLAINERCDEPRASDLIRDWFNE